MIKLHLEHGPGPSRDDILDRSFVEVCCEAFELAVASGVVRLDRTLGRAYLAGGGHFFVIAGCPFCFATRGEPARVMEETHAAKQLRERFKFRRACGVCRKQGHDARTCPGFGE